MPSNSKPASALLLAALSGAGGLMHQTLWVRRMVDVLGADAGTFSRVVAAFFLGLAVGSFWAARTETKWPWRSVAKAELSVVLLSLGILFSAQLAQTWLPGPVAARIMRWVLPLILITPPAIAMGMVIPWMIRGLPSRHAVSIYGVNTLGGIAGVALSLGWALPALGLFGASLVAMSLNLAVAVAAWGIGSDTEAEPLFQKGSRPTPSSGLALAFASGFLVLGAEVLLQHQFSQLLISSHFSSAFVLTLVLASLGLAALLAHLFSRLGSSALSVALGVSALLCAIQPFLLIVQKGGLNYLPFEKPFTTYALEALRWGLPACAMPMLAAGFVFPLLLRNAARKGVDVGWLLAVNGIGGWLGAEVTERLIAPTFGLWWGMSFLSSGYIICFAFHQTGWARWCGSLLLAGILASTCKINGRLPYAGLVPGDHLLHVSVGREGVVGIIRGEPDDWRIIFNNTYTLGGSRAQINQERQTLLPVLLHGNARRVGTLGVATGSSVAGAALDPGVEHVEGIELSPLVLRFARDYFGPYNRSVFTNPRVTFTYGDARWVIARKPAEFDVIEGDLFLPWRTGESRLFSVEHFGSVRRALRPGGIYCQWLPMYQLTGKQFEVIVRTFREVFPEAWVIRGDFYANMPIVGLVGGIGLQEVDWEKVRMACARVREQGDCHDPLLRHVEGVAMCVAGPVKDPGPGPINTLANSWLEWDASRNVIGLKEPWFNGVPCAQYLREAQKRGAPLLPEPLRSPQAYGDLSIALEIARTAKLPQAESLEEQFRLTLPKQMKDDPGADWSRWPMKFRPDSAK